MVSDKWELFERFVDLTDSLWWTIESYPLISTFFSAALVLSNWFIFRYHKAAVQDYSFFIENLAVAGRFSKPTFEMWRWLAITVAPVGIGVVCFSLATAGHTQSFLAVFGIKGAGAVKNRIIAHVLRRHALMWFIKTPKERRKGQYAVDNESQH